MKLNWVTRNGLLVADTGGHGRYIVRRHANGGFMLVLNGALVATLDSEAEAKARAELGLRTPRHPHPLMVQYFCSAISAAFDFRYYAITAQALTKAK